MGRNNIIHTLKTWPEYFQAILRGEKTFEVRKDDRAFAVGNILVLQEYDPEKKEYTGNKTSVRVTYKMEGGVFGVAEGHCVLGIKTTYGTKCKELRTYPARYDTIVCSAEPYEIYVPDDDFSVGDDLLLREFDTEKGIYTGRSMVVKIKYKKYRGDFGPLPVGQCALGLQYEA